MGPSRYESRTLRKIDWVNGKCDKYDYLIAAFCGMTAGIVDIFFVGAPGESMLGGWTNDQADKVVIKFAQMVAKSDGAKPGKIKDGNVASAIGYLEKRFPINYDQRYSADVGNAFSMSTKNHHYKSLGHSPDIIGLFFSILDQFQGKASFISDGQMIRIDTATQELQGSNIPSKIFCGFCNWFGHVMSDVAGSSGSRGNSGGGKGSGVSIPFFEMFGLCDFGSFQVNQDRQSIAMIATRAFQEGYDLRFGAAMAIPVLVCDLSIRFIWAMKRHYYHGEHWEKCIPTNQHAELRCMLIVGNASLCFVDGVDTFVKSGGNALTFILRLNYVAWLKLLLMIMKEILIRYDFTYQDLRDELRIFNRELDVYIEMLKRVDYTAYERELGEVQSINKLLESNSNDLTPMYNFLMETGANIQFSNFEEFDQKMQDDTFILQI